MTRWPRFMVAAAHKSSGKTVVSAGLARALTRSGDDVGVFKKGPDYIDPMWLKRAAGRAAYNLDFNTLSKPEIRALFADKAEGRDINLVEANKGLFDGVACDGCDSNAALAKLLGLPVVLVVDTRGMTRGVAPLLMGYTRFDPDVNIAGVILNKVGGPRHEGKLVSAIETYTDLPVLGAVGASRALDISERHLGLTTPDELTGTSDFLCNVAAEVARSVDLDRLRDLAQNTADFDAPARDVPTAKLPPLRIAIARDEAFAFYYADDLEAFAAMGAELVPVDLLRDRALPEVDGLFIGGGFPEVFADGLAANSAMRASVRDALEAGLPTYAECGGLMYLCRTLGWSGDSHAGAGFFAADAVMHRKPQGRGHVRFTMTDDALWPSGAGEQKAHEFHYASLDNIGDARFGRVVTRGHGIDGTHDGLVKANTQAGFIHLRHSNATPWVRDFLDFVARVKAGGAAQAHKKSPALEARGR